jgi:hypothetical protein
MLIFMSGTCLVSRLDFSHLGPRAAGMVAGRILSGSGRVRGAPDRWSCFGRAACRGAGPAAAAEAGGA